jgi:pyrroline-5-carboxylate reductase
MSTIIGFLGAGKMARALAAGLAKARPGEFAFAATARTSETLDAFERAVGTPVRRVADNAALAATCDVVVLGIKPGQAAEVLAPLAGSDRLFVSLLAGVTVAKLEALLGPQARVVRTMPNTPALIGEGITGYAPGTRATADDWRTVETILSAVGEAVRVEEKDLDAVTAVSGSGPAYVYHFLNALIEGGAAQGLAPEVARRLAVQTVIGAAKMVGENPALSPLDLAAQVKSPNGTTVAACAVLESRKWEEALRDAVAAARKRAAELSGNT